MDGILPSGVLALEGFLLFVTADEKVGTSSSLKNGLLGRGRNKIDSTAYNRERMKIEAQLPWNARD